MPIGTLLLGLALLIIIGFVIALPLFDRRRAALQPPTKRQSLEGERRDIVRAIRELDFDHRTHKINDDDYKQLREQHVQRGAQVLRELSALDAAADALDVTIAPAATVASDADAADIAIERRIAALRKGGKHAAHPSKGTCPNCGKAITSADKFCPQCGHKLAA